MAVLFSSPICSVFAALALISLWLLASLDNFSPNIYLKQLLTGYPSRKFFSLMKRVSGQVTKVMAD